MPTIVPKSVQTCFELVMGNFFWKIFFPSVPWRVESSKCFQKIKKISNFQKCPNSFPKTVQTCFEHVFGVIFFEKIFCPVFHGVSSLRNAFVKKLQIFQISKNAQNRSQIVQTCFEQVLGYFFRKKFLPSVPWMVESSKCFQKIKIFSKFHNCTKSFPKVSKRVLNMFWGNFSEKFFCPVFHGGSSLRNVFKKWKNFQTSIIAQNRSQKCANVFWTSVGLTFSNNFFAQCSMEGRVFEMLLKKLKIFKFPKMPKIVPKLSKRVLNKFWGNFSEKNLCPVFHGWSSLRNVFKKSKNFQTSIIAQNRSQKCPNVFWTCFEVIFLKFCCPVFHGGSSLRNVFTKSKIFKIPKMPKIVPKLSKSVLNMFWGNFFEKIFLPSVPWRVEYSKCFQKIENISKFHNCPKSFPNCPKVFWTCFGVLFPEFLFAQCCMEGRVFEMFLKNQKTFKIPKKPKIVPKSAQTRFEHVLRYFFRNFFLPSVPWRIDLRNVFKNRKYFKISKNAHNRSQKCPNVFWTCFGEFFLKNFFAQCSMEGRVFEMFSKNQKNFKFPKMPKIVPKNRPNVFWTCFRGNFFEKIFCPVFHGVSSLRNVFVKKLKIFQISKNAQNRSQIVQTCFEQVLG